MNNGRSLSGIAKWKCTERERFVEAMARRKDPIPHHAPCACGAEAEAAAEASAAVEGEVATVEAVSADTSGSGVVQKVLELGAGPGDLHRHLFPDLPIVTVVLVAQDGMPNISRAKVTAALTTRLLSVSVCVLYRDEVVLSGSVL
jgi:hypothetical protein